MFLLLAISSPQHHVDTAIIGGGVAGLSTAMHLQNTKSVIILEAGECLGGRALTHHDKNGNPVCEQGATFISPEHKKMFELIELINGDGKIRPWHARLHSWFKGADKIKLTKGLDISNPMVVVDRNGKCSFSKIRGMLSDENMNFLDLALNRDECGADIFEISSERNDLKLLNYAHLIPFLPKLASLFYNPFASIEGGITHLVNELAKLVEKRGVVIQKNSRVTNVVKEADVFVLTYSDGAKLHANRVVSTIPLCTLQKNNVFGNLINKGMLDIQLWGSPYASNRKVFVPLKEMPKTSYYMDISSIDCACAGWPNTIDGQPGLMLNLGGSPTKGKNFDSVIATVSKNIYNTFGEGNGDILSFDYSANSETGGSYGNREIKVEEIFPKGTGLYFAGDTVVDGYMNSAAISGALTAININLEILQKSLPEIKKNN